MKKYYLENYMVLAKKFYNQEQLYKALTYYKKAYDGGMKDNTELLIEMALLYDEMEDYGNSLQMYKEVLKLDKTEARAYYGIAILYDHRDKFKRAIPYYKKAIFYDEKFLKAYFFLAYAYDQIGHVNEAIENYKKVLEIDPYDFWTCINLGSIYEQSNENQKALTLMKNAYQVDREHHMVLYNLGVIYKKLNQLEQAIFYYEEAIKVKEDYAYSYLNLAIIYKEQEAYYQAIKTITIGIDHNPRTFLFYNRACCYLLNDQPKEAEKDILTVIKQSPEMVDYLIDDEELEGFISQSPALLKALQPYRTL